MNINLIVCIPTYKRTRFLIDLLSSVNEAYTWCRDKLDSESINLRYIISDNEMNSGSHDAIIAQLPIILKRLLYKRNFSNIGIERNILKVIEMGILLYGPSDNTYIWAIGDDDLVSTSSIFDIYSAIRVSNPIRPGLVICSEHPGAKELKLIVGAYANYSDAIRCFDKIYPQRPIHHTLMSLNVFRSDIYDSIMARDSLGTLYAQMYGVIHSHSFLNMPVIHLGGHQVILRSDTEGFHDKKLYQEVPFRWAEYYTRTRMLHLPYRSGHILKSALHSDYWRS